MNARPGRASPRSSSALFAASRIVAGSVIGPYCGTVRTEEEWEERHAESHYCVVINDGASGVVVDGEVRCCSCI